MILLRPDDGRPPLEIEMAFSMMLRHETFVGGKTMESNVSVRLTRLGPQQILVPATQIHSKRQSIRG